MDWKLEGLLAGKKKREPEKMTLPHLMEDLKNWDVLDNFVELIEAVDVQGDVLHVAEGNVDGLDHGAADDETQ